MTQLNLYNTLAKKLQEFSPTDTGKVKMYVCGPTVYDFAHIGNARSFVIYDVLYRLLCKIYGDGSVLYVRNITDVDDKINDRAKKLGISIQKLTSETTKNFKEDMKYLNALDPNIEPRATDHIKDMTNMIQILLDKDYAYQAEGTIYFSVNKFKEYYHLSGRNADEMISGTRIEIDQFKKNSADFVLWKPCDKDDDPSSIFESPFGRGKPGWHIECSAMSHAYLGENFDIHGGGIDLIFPHHTNEVAQSKCAYPNSSHAKYWIHNGFLTVNGEKMSKSLGNFITVRDLENKGIRGEAVRYLLLSAHYRKPLDFNDKNLKDAQENLDYLYRATKIIDFEENIQEASETRNLDESFLACLFDDINTPAAFAQLIKIANDVNKASNTQEKLALAKKLKASANFIGLLTHSYKAWFGQELDLYELEFIDKKIAERLDAKKNKNFALADQIRNELAAKGIFLEDTSDGTKWHR